MTRRNLMQLMAMVVVLLLTAGTALAADGIKDRMLARAPAINALKAQGIVGENNKGYLEFVGGKSASVSEVNAENSDRSQVYKVIAKQQGTSSDLVGRRRALQIAEGAAPGTWLQSTDGSWRQK